MARRDVPRYERQAQIDHTERYKRKNTIYGTVADYGWFYMDYFSSDPIALQLMYEEVEAFLEENLEDYLTQEKAQYGEE